MPRPGNEKVSRLLIIDNSTGHKAINIVNYCIMFDVAFCTLPPRSTHILQLLENAHQKASRQSIREGDLAFIRRIFAVAFKYVYLEGFSAAHIMGDFEGSGIYPITHEPAVWYIL